MSNLDQDDAKPKTNLDQNDAKPYIYLDRFKKKHPIHPCEYVYDAEDAAHTIVPSLQDPIIGSSCTQPGQTAHALLASLPLEFTT
jgi:hypothetical protein